MSGVCPLTQAELQVFCSLVKANYIHGGVKCLKLAIFACPVFFGFLPLRVRELIMLVRVFFYQTHRPATSAQTTTLQPGAGLQPLEDAFEKFPFLQSLFYFSIRYTSVP